MSTTTNIYGLYDPRELVDGEIDMIRYVGKADKPLDRLQGHISYSHNKRKKYRIHNWICELVEEGAKPLMLILCRVPMKYWQGMEQHVIDTMWDEGHDLLNVAEGGDGFTSEEMKRMWDRPEARARASAATTKYFEDHPEARAKASAIKKQYYEDHPEARAKSSVAMKQYFEDHPEALAKRSAAVKRSKNNPEARARNSATRNREWAPGGVLRIKQLRAKVKRSMLQKYDQEQLTDYPLAA